MALKLELEWRRCPYPLQTFPTARINSIIRSKVRRFSAWWSSFLTWKEKRGEKVTKLSRGIDLVFRRKEQGKGKVVGGGKVCWIEVKVTMTTATGNSIKLFPRATPLTMTTLKYFSLAGSVGLMLSLTASNNNARNSHSQMLPSCITLA